MRFLRPLQPLVFLAFGLSFPCAPVLACSCWGTTGIGTAMTGAEIVVVGRVEYRAERQLEYRAGSELTVDFTYPAPIVVKVGEALKGNVGEEIRITTDFMCYRSFDLEDFKPGDTFVFPIWKTTTSGIHVLPSCSHSALKLVDGQLYTNEFIQGGGRRLDRYMSLTMLRILLPLYLLDTGVQIVLAGALALLLPMLITPRIRRRVAQAVPADPLPNPLGALRSVNSRTGFAIAWMLLCAGFSLFLVLGKNDLSLWPVGFALALLFAFAAAGLALRWGWTEGLSYGLALLWIGVCLVGMYQALSEYFRLYDHIDKKLFVRSSVVPLSIVLSIIIGMLFYADAVRRRFSRAPQNAPTSAPPA